MSGIVRFLTCGSVDDGKSTMIGRLLYDAGLIYDDHISGIKNELEKRGLKDTEIDFSFLLDGLLSEREQGITIDVAYRYFNIKDRKYIVADTPGHTQYTKNMATGASNCDSAIILIDARKGLGIQTYRHAFICSLMGIKKILFALNKFDLVHWDECVFNDLKTNCTNLISNLENIGHSKINFDIVPISALLGDNLINNSENMNWYQGQTIFQWLENINFVDNNVNDKNIFIVQNVLNSVTNLNSFQEDALVQLTSSEIKKFRAFAGKVNSGSFSLGQNIKILSSNLQTTVKGIIKDFSFVKSAAKDDSIAIICEDEIDISKGDLIISSDYNLIKNDTFTANIIWMENDELNLNTQYILHSYFGYVDFKFNKILYKFNLENFNKEEVTKLIINEVGLVEIKTSKNVYFEKYSIDKTLGSFIIIDKISNRTIACGMINSVIEQTEDNIEINNKKPFIIWFTGLSGSGKTTLSRNLQKLLDLKGIKTINLDGDELRTGLSSDLGFSDSDRTENIRRATEISKLILTSNTNVLCSFISPFEKDRLFARIILKEFTFIEIFVNAPLEVCEKRDVKGFYNRARNGNLNNFTGISSNYEIPNSPEIEIDTDLLSIDESIKIISDYLIINHII